MELRMFKKLLVNKFGYNLSKINIEKLEIPLDIDEISVDIIRSMLSFIVRPCKKIYLQPLKEGML